MNKHTKANASAGKNNEDISVGRAAFKETVFVLTNAVLDPQKAKGRRK